jgi:hypothetical protein
MAAPDHFTEAWPVKPSEFTVNHPTPWKAMVNPGLRRATIYDASGAMVLSGINNSKAAFIVQAANAYTRRKLR